MVVEWKLNKEGILEMSNQTLEGFRLSPQQKSLWTLQQLTEGIPYRVQAGIMIGGNLNKEILNIVLQKSMIIIPSLV